MAHTDRDDKRYLYKHHGKTCNRGYWWPDDNECICDQWFDYSHAKFWPIPSYFKTDCRREERAKARNMMQRAKTGRIDWDDLAINYRRPYYW